MKHFVLYPLILLCLLPARPLPVLAGDVRIGVLAFRGPEDIQKNWQQVADYLSARIPDHHFVIVPLNRKGMADMVDKNLLDFVVVDPGQYIEFEDRHQASRIATLLKRVGGKESACFGSVIFTRADNPDIRTIADLKGKTLVTAHEHSFASWYVTRDELSRHGVATADLAAVEFTGIPTGNVVMAVKRGTADAGAVRTDILEQMAEEGKISLSDFRILDPRQVPGFPFLLTSALYPEFAFAKLTGTDPALATKVAAHLLLMPLNQTAGARGRIGIGWTVSDNYESVRKLLQTWRLPPYQDYGRVTLGEALRQHWVTVSLSAAVILSLSTVLFLLLNIRERRTQFLELTKAKQEVSEKVEQLEAALTKVRQLEGLISICSYCKKIRDDEETWHQLEQYLVGHSEAKFSHGICPECYDKQMLEIRAMTI